MRFTAAQVALTEGQDIVANFLRSYFAVILGLVGLLIGAAAVGISLVLAGHDAAKWATGLGIVAVVGVGGGLGLLVIAFHHRGGLLRSRVVRPDRSESRDDQRESKSSADTSETRRN